MKILRIPRLIPVVLLNISLCKIILPIVQVPINVDERNQFRWQAIEIKYVDIIDGPSARWQTFDLNIIVIHISINFSISQGLNLNAWYDVIEDHLLKTGLVHACSVKRKLRDDDCEGCIWMRAKKI